MTSDMSCSMSRIVIPRSWILRIVPMSAAVSCSFIPPAGSSRISEPGLRCQRPGDLEEPLVAVGEVFGQLHLLALQPHEGQLVEGPGEGRALLPRSPGSAEHGRDGARVHPAVAAGQHVFEHGEILEEADGLEGPGDAELDDAVGGPVRDVSALEADSSPVGAVIAGDEVEDGGLARPVRADEPDDGPLLHVEGDFVYGRQSAEGLGNALKLQQAHGAPPALRASGSA